ncbi:MAG: ATP-binding cassette domain-containing protein [Cytophagales bacterium]|nr:ATP-binding cassette domain-containing protein [Cytophagales bacterium]
MSISIHNLTKVYGSQKAIDSLSFDIPKGQIVGFLGPNGAGKSTTMKILTGYLEATSGTASVNGFDVQKEDMQAKNSIGYLPEHNPLYLEMYVKEFLEFAGSLYKMKGAALKNRVAEIIEQVGLSRESHKKIGQLSKGYRQRVGLAQALIHDPEVLILDEPTTGLDPNQLAEIRALIKEVGKDKTVILSTHIMQEVESICERAIIINLGKIVADKSIKELKSAGQSMEEVFRELTGKHNEANNA